MSALRAFVATALLLAAPAIACSIFLPTVDSTFPATGATEVPLNAEVKFVSRRPLPWALTDELGATVAATGSRRGWLTTVRPSAPLSPLATYTLTVTDDQDTGTVTVSFTTGTASDAVAPRLQGPPSIYPAKSDPFGPKTSCSSNAQLYTVVFPSAGDDATPFGELLVEGVVALTEEGLEAEPNFLERCTATSSGQAECALAVVTADRTPRYFKARVIDLAGNASEVSAVQPLHGCGCGSAEGAMALVALAVLRRGRRTTKFAGHGHGQSHVPRT